MHHVTVRRALAGLLACFLLLPACSLGRVVGDAETRALSKLDESLGELAAQSANWQQVIARLQTSIEDLPDELRSTIDHELTNLAQRTIAAAGEQFACAVDFLGQRVRDGLQRVKDIVQGTETPVRPVLCSVTPNQIDLNLAPDRRNRVEFSGFNFDAPGMAAFLVEEGQETDVTTHLTGQTHYHKTLNLGGSTPAQGVQVGAASLRVVLRWNGEELSAVPVLQVAPVGPSACARETFTTSPVSYTFTPPHTNGDKDFFGNLDVIVRVSLVTGETNLQATVYMWAHQYRDDQTTAEGEAATVLFTAPPGRRIESVSAPSQDPELSYHDDDDGVDYFGGGGGLVASYSVQGDHYGDDAEVWTNVTVVFNPLTLQLVETGNCVA